MSLDIERIRARRPQNDIRYFRKIGSTMDEAAKLAAAGASHGTVVLADEQTAGIGRFGRSWISESDVGIYCSMLLRLPLQPDNLPIATVLLGLATAEAIEKVTPVACDLRWPNDVLVGDRKVAGILAQLVDTCVIAGIGINVNQAEMPTGLRTPATSILIESGGKVQSREEIVSALLDSVDTFCSMLAAEGADGILRAFTIISSYAVDRRVVVEESGFKGVTAGLDDNGFLLVRSDSGKIERVTAGGVRPDVATPV
jgi:BirA family transcriptional regulator, biotin operon repressor / biotin---[acetyl-CoA-carboxylase] ligase